MNDRQTLPETIHLGDLVIYARSQLEAREVYDLVNQHHATQPDGYVDVFSGKKVRWHRLGSTTAHHDTCPQ